MQNTKIYSLVNTLWSIAKLFNEIAFFFFLNPKLLQALIVLEATVVFFSNVQPQSLGRT